jgi:hypothetical protein
VSATIFSHFRPTVIARKIFPSQVILDRIRLTELPESHISVIICQKVFLSNIPSMALVESLPVSITQRVIVVSWENYTDVFEILVFLKSVECNIVNIMLIEPATFSPTHRILLIACIIEWIRQAMIKFEIIFADSATGNNCQQNYIRGICS